MQGQFSLLRELLQPDTAKARVWMQVNSDITYIHGIPSRLSEVALRFDIDWLAELLIGKITFELEDDFAPDCLAEAVRGEGKVLAVLLKHPKGKSLRIEERVVTQIARIFDENVMELLLDHRGEEVKITAEVVQAAAANSKEMMKLLLDTAEIYMQSIHARRQAACIPEAILPSHPPCKGACCTIGQYPVLHRLHFRRMRTLPCPWNNFHPLRPECFQECSGRIENSEGSYALSVSWIIVSQ